VSTCIGAQHARQIAELTAEELQRQARLLTLLADELGVDLDRLELVDRVDRRGGVVVTWQEAEALGLHNPEHGPAA
jgi:hypothetical protein